MTTSLLSISVMGPKADFLLCSHDSGVELTHFLFPLIQIMNFFDTALVMRQVYWKRLLVPIVLAHIRLKV